ncbi:MAG TPA: hypothetical protein VLI45_09165 [Acidobacteriaceae bacterium]|nr:hypothetical protein [Acidobacteriaceae bacterium]
MPFDDTLIAVLASQGLTLVAAVAAARATLRGLERRVDELETAQKELPKEFVPRREIELTLQNIDRSTTHTNSLVLALIHSGGNPTIALKAIEAAEQAPDGISLRAADEEAWFADYVDHRLPAFEGDISWLYLDTADHVTAGSGLMIPDAHAALALPLHTPAGELATQEQIIAEFHHVASRTPGRVASFYFSPSSLVLRADDRATLRRSRCQTFLTQLRLIFRGFDSFPGPAKAGLLDMAFNMGVGRPYRPGAPATGLLGFSRLCACACMRDWKHVADECTREPGNRAFDARNAWTRTQFLSAAQEAKA